MGAWDIGDMTEKRSTPLTSWVVASLVLCSAARCCGAAGTTSVGQAPLVDHPFLICTVLVIGLAGGLAVSLLVLRRTAADPTERPLLKVDDPKQRIKELMAFRRPLYKHAADITVSTSRLTAEGVADEIVRALNQDEDFNLKK